MNFCNSFRYYHSCPNIPDTKHDICQTYYRNRISGQNFYQLKHVRRNYFTHDKTVEMHLGSLYVKICEYVKFLPFERKVVLGAYNSFDTAAGHISRINNIFLTILAFRNKGAIIVNPTLLRKSRVHLRYEEKTF